MATSFFSMLKWALIHRRPFDRFDARRAIFEYIEVFYNNAGAMTNHSPPPAHVDPLRWMAMAVAGILLLSYPWLAPFLQQQFVLGIPLFFLYQYGVWAALILAVALLRSEG